MSGQIIWIDSLGVGILSNGKPAPATRFSNWTPDVEPIGPSVVGLGTGVTHRFEFRRDDTVSFEIDKIPGTELSLMKRLKYHLLNGGDIQVQSDRPLASEYETSIMAPGTVPQIEFTDRQLGEYTFSVVLKGQGQGTGGFVYPSFVPGLKLWLKGDNATLVATKNEAEFVGGWYDDSGEGNDAVQGNETKQPRWYPDIINGHPVVRFDGSNDQLVTPDIMIPTVAPGSTFFWVARRIGAASGENDVIMAFAPTGGEGDTDESSIIEWNTLPGDVSWYRKQAGGTAQIGAGTVGSFHIHALEFVDVTNTVPYADGTAGAAFAPFDQIESSLRLRLVIGGVGGFPRPPLEFAEIIWYSGVLSTANRNGITRYLSQKYAITVSV